MHVRPRQPFAAPTQQPTPPPTPPRALQPLPDADRGPFPLPELELPPAAQAPGLWRRVLARAGRCLAGLLRGVP